MRKLKLEKMPTRILLKFEKNNKNNEKRLKNILIS